MAYIHTDHRAMPRNKKAWSSWNSSIDDKDLEKNSISVHREGKKINVLDGFKALFAIIRYRFLK